MCPQGLDVITRLGRFVCFSVFNGDVVADWSLIGMNREFVKNDNRLKTTTTNIFDIPAFLSSK